jgi:hypothetical protein
MATLKKGYPGKPVIQSCVDIIRSFNPVTHSVDTHCAEILGDVTSQVKQISFPFHIGLSNNKLNHYVIFM